MKLTSIVVLGLVVLTAAPTAAQRRLGIGRRGAGGSFGPLMAMEEVQKELNLTKDDVVRIEEILDEYPPVRVDREAVRQGELSRDDIDRRLHIVWQEIDGRLKDALSPEQHRRFNELRLQFEGIRSLDRPEIADRLELSLDQRETIHKLTVQNREQFRSRRPGPPLGGDQARELRRKFRSEALEALTPEQRTAWDVLQGKRFDFPSRMLPPFGAETRDDSTGKPRAGG